MELNAQLPPVRGYVTSEATFSPLDEADGASSGDDSDDVAAPTQTAAASAAASANGGKDLSKTAAAHTYDAGYKKWENFDEVRCCEAVAGGAPCVARTDCASTCRQDTAVVVEAEPSAKPKRKPKATSSGAGAGSAAAAAATKPTPASIAGPAATSASHGGRNGALFDTSKRRRARDVAKSREQVEREDGNQHFMAGRFNEAVKCYTRCVALNPANEIAYSNRAMAYLRLHQYRQAEEDCTRALEVRPDHIKSLLRRGTAKNALGRHRQALADFERVLVLDPSSKKVRVRWCGCAVCVCACKRARVHD